jgi:Flp pilus assembly protein TadD
MKPTLRTGWAVLLLVALTALVYFPATRGGFIWDDESYVIGNANLRSAEGLGRIWFEPRTSPQYYPLVFTSLWLNFQAHGLDPTGYHVVNIALHLLAALLAWRVLVALGLPGAWLAAALFALHPVHVESVAWITERKNVLSGFFYLASALAYLRFAGHTAGRPRQPAVYVLALVLFAAALLSKSVTASLPAALLVAVWWKQGRVRWADVAPLLPFLALGAAAGLHTAWLERAHVGAEGAEWHLSLLDRTLIASRALVFYAGKLVWPHPLIFMYPRWEVGSGIGWYAFPLLVAGVFALLWRQRASWGRGPLAAALFFAGTLLPALGFLNVYPMRYTFVADHYQYLASLGLLAVAGCGLSRLGGATGAGVAAALLLAAGSLTWNRAQVFRSAEALWTDTVQRNPSSWMAHNNLGLLRAGQGRWADAVRSYRRALDLRPASPETLTNLGMALLAQGQPREAIAQHQAAVALDPAYADGWNNLGIVQAEQGDPAAGVASLRKALSLQPRFPDAWMNLGHAYMAGGRVADAMTAYRQALAQRPGWPEAANNLAWLLVVAPDPALRQPAKAVELAEWACAATQQRDANALDTLAAAYAAVGRFPQAVKTAEKAASVARAAGQTAHADRITKRLDDYRAGRPVTP